MRLIDADALKIHNVSPCYGYYIDGVTDGDIEDAPTIDAVPVIRCKDCKWYKTNYSWNGKEHRVCVIEPYEPARKADDFCSRAERKDNG